MTRILIVEDESSLSEPLAYLLEREGYETTIADDGQLAVAEFDRNGADLILLDLMLPGMSGVEVCREIRTRSTVPIIMVTAKDSEVDIVVGLELGADDYVTKPYRTRELLARIRAVLRRRIDTDASDNLVLEAGGQLIDRVWGADYVGDTKTLDVHIKRIRSKIEKIPGEPSMLVTVRGLGYRFEA
ncbi:MAG: response regulator transcription factor [Rhodoglobus sp.]